VTGCETGGKKGTNDKASFVKEIIDCPPSLKGSSEQIFNPTKYIVTF